MTNEIKNIYHLFRFATARSVCANVGCSACHDIYNSESCPTEEPVSDEQLYDFVHSVVTALANYHNTFGPDITEDELINIFLENYHGQN